MSSTENVIELRKTVRAWVADKKTAATIDASDIRVLQNVFDGKLNVVHTNDGGIAIFPHCPGERVMFDAFMEENGRFEQRPIQITKI